MSRLDHFTSNYIQFVVKHFANTRMFTCVVYIIYIYIAEILASRQNTKNPHSTFILLYIVYILPHVFLLFYYYVREINSDEYLPTRVKYFKLLYTNNAIGTTIHLAGRCNWTLSYFNHATKKILSTTELFFFFLWASLVYCERIGANVFLLPYFVDVYVIDIALQKLIA